MSASRRSIAYNYMNKILPCIANDRSTEIFQAAPWEYVPNIPEHLLNDKRAYLTWRGAPDTKHLLFLGSEGVSPTVRPNNDTNPICRLHAIIADYDSKITSAMEEELSNAPVIPNWISDTFSGGRRLVWLCDAAVPWDSQISKAFYGIAERVLQLPKLLPGLDDAFFNATRAYDVGSNWRQLSDKPLPKNTLHFWLLEA